MTTKKTPALVRAEEFEIATSTLEDEEGWLIGTDGVVDPDGNIAILLADDDENPSEAGHGMTEWLALTGAVAAFVIAVFSILGPAFIAAFETQITNALP